MTHLELLALEAGAMQLGEDGPPGPHYILDGSQLARFAELVRQEPEELPLPPY